MALSPLLLRLHTQAFPAPSGCNVFAYVKEGMVKHQPPLHRSSAIPAGKPRSMRSNTPVED
jgi:hypothetical protein